MHTLRRVGLVLCVVALFAVPQVHAAQVRGGPTDPAAMAVLSPADDLLFVPSSKYLPNITSLARDAYDSRAVVICGEEAPLAFRLSTGVVAHAAVGDIKVSRLLGSRLDCRDLIGLLEARVIANRTGHGPMTGQVATLLNMTLNVVGISGDGAALPAVRALMRDPEPAIAKRATVIARMLENREFPVPAIHVQVAPDLGIVEVVDLANGEQMFVLNPRLLQTWE